MKFLYSCLIGLLLVTTSPVALADVDISQRQNGKLRVAAEDVANGAILESLSRELRFRLTIDNAQWAKQKRSIERTGNLDAILKTLLSGTNHLVSYDGDGVSSVAVLTPGSRGPGAVASGPSNTPLAAASAGDPQQRPTPITAEMLGAEPTPVDPSAVADAQTDSSQANATDTEDPTEEKALTSTPTSINQLLRTHASASLSDAATGTDAMPAVALRAPADPQAPNPALARITQQAQQDVQAMVKMLRQAEAQLQPASQ